MSPNHSNPSFLARTHPLGANNRGQGRAMGGGMGAGMGAGQSEYAHHWSRHPVICYNHYASY
jgi:hypothetical protein